MRRTETPKIYKKALLVGGAVVLLLCVVYVMTYKPSQTIEIGEYKNYQIK